MSTPAVGPRLRLDPWDVDYGSELPFDDGATDSDDTGVDLAVEYAPESWRPLEPAGAGPAYSGLVFVDGVRRLERRVLVGGPPGGTTGDETDDGWGHAAFGSFAVGGVEVAALAGAGSVEAGQAVESARFGATLVERRLALGGGRTWPASLDVGYGLVYVPVSSTRDDPQAPLARLQEEMRAAEQRLARQEADREGRLVICDGPLTFGDRVRGAALGLVKRLHRLYLPPAQARVLACLQPGGRTPLFHLARPQGLARYAWFVRLTAPRAVETELAGLVRLEVSDAVGLEHAVRLADDTARLLPRFASTPGRDPRAPQNLLPVGALERRLRHLLGDARLVRRQVEIWLQRQAVGRA